MSPKSLIAGLRPTHPGEVLREDVFPALGRSRLDPAIAASEALRLIRSC